MLIQYAELIYTRSDKKQSEDIENKGLASKIKKMSNTDLTKKPRLRPLLHENTTKSQTWSWIHVIYGYFLTLSKECVNFHLYVATFQQHPYMEYISLSWNGISERVVPIRIPWLITGFVTRLTLPVSLVQQELVTLT